MSFSNFGQGHSNNNNNDCGHGHGFGHDHHDHHHQGNQYQMQQQQLVSKQNQVQETVNAQIVLEMTQTCIKNIRKLGDLYIADEQRKQRKQGQSGQSGHKTLGSNDDDEKNGGGRSGGVNNNDEIFDQQMIAGQLLNTLRLAMSDKSIANNATAHKLSLLELGKFKQELLNANVSKSIIEKILPFVEAMQVTLQDYKKSFHVPGPKLDPTTFNQETVTAGMGIFLGSQHEISQRKTDISKNAEKIGDKHNQALKNKSNQELVNKMKNEKIDSSKMTVNSIFSDIDKKYLDIDNNDNGNNNNNDCHDEDLTMELNYGREGMKEELYRQNEQAAAQAKQRQQRQQQGNQYYNGK